MTKTLKGSFTGEAMIYKKDTDWGYPQYSVKLSTKNPQTDEWEYTYMQVQLPKNALINDKTPVIINKSFFSFFRTKSGEDRFKLVILDYEIENQSAGDIDIPENADKTVNFDTDLPW